MTPSPDKIKCIGMPPPDLLDPTHNLGPGLASSQEAQEFNRLSFPTNKEEHYTSICVDQLDIHQEDPFTLETFESLIEEHMKAKKDFILARVMTVPEDKKENPERVFVNWYAAHQINRSLFRTQPEEGLLHRMKAKNPMNNLTIVGDVHYFVIRHNDVLSNPLYAAEKKTEPLKTSLINKSTPLSTIPFTLLDKHMQLADQRPPSPQPEPKRRSFDLEENKSSGHRHSRRFSDCVEFICTHALKAPTEKLSLDRCLICQLQKEEEQKSTIQVPPSPPKTPELPIQFTAYYYATDDDYLMRRPIREYFKENSLNTEDIFLFTLFGATGADGSPSAQAMVSDPTNPLARAMRLEDAVAQFVQEQRRLMSLELEEEEENLATLSSTGMTGGQRVRRNFGQLVGTIIGIRRTNTERVDVESQQERRLQTKQKWMRSVVIILIVSIPLSLLALIIKAAVDSKK